MSSYLIFRRDKTQGARLGSRCPKPRRWWSAGRRRWVLKQTKHRVFQTMFVKYFLRNLIQDKANIYYMNLCLLTTTG